MNEMSERDQQLARRLSATLGRSTEAPDPALDQALAAARTAALGQRRHRQQPLRPWLWASGMALAAGLAMMVVIPGGTVPTPKHHIQTQVLPQNAEAASRPTLEDPEMLEDMDMLQALAAEPAHAGQG